MAGFFINSMSIMCSYIEHLREQYPCINLQYLWILLNYGMFADWKKVSITLSKRQDNGFIHCATDNSLFIYKSGDILWYCLVYIDDIIVIKNSDSFVNDIIQQLGSTFLIKKHEISVFFFLWIEVISAPQCLFLSQHKYIRELFSQTSMDNAKEIITPCLL